MGWPDYQRQIWFRIVLKERTDLPLLPLEMIMEIEKYIDRKIVKHGISFITHELYHRPLLIIGKKRYYDLKK